jgi:hypothetical protein
MTALNVVGGFQVLTKGPARGGAFSTPLPPTGVGSESSRDSSGPITPAGLEAADDSFPASFGKYPFPALRIKE